MRIYTRGGDNGETSLFDGRRVPKYDLRVATYGSIDELNSILSWARATSTSKDISTRLERIQNELFTLGADFATPQDAKRTSKRMTAAMVDALEKDIDRFMGEVGNPEGFVLPGESEEASRLHIARTTCRRAERIAAELGKRESVNGEAIKYLNRLSDALYAMAVWTDKVARGKTLKNPVY